MNSISNSDAQFRPLSYEAHHNAEYELEVQQQLIKCSQILEPAPLQRISLASYESQFDSRDGSFYIGKRVNLPKVAREYPMPDARETHEMAVVGRDLLVVTQQSNSTLVKVLLHPSTGRPVACARYLVGDFWDGLHGLCSSVVYVGDVWVSLQYKSQIVRLNPGMDLATPPRIVQEIALPPSVYGPHCVCECGQDLWISCKDSSHVVRINHANPDDYSIYPCSRRPIFIAMHPTSGDFYASLDLSNKIWRLKPSTQETSELDIPSVHGTTPVGLISGADKNVWFTLLGNANGGNGTFGRILSDGGLEFFSLSVPVGLRAGLIHLAFDWEYSPKASGPPHIHHLWLLSSSLIASTEGYGIDAVFSILFDEDEVADSRIKCQHSISLPTQRCKNHRILPHRTGLFVSQLAISSLAHVSGAAAFKPAELVGETTDRYNFFGQGVSSSLYYIAEDPVNRSGLLPRSPSSILNLPASEEMDPRKQRSNSIIGRASKRQRNGR
ncbi:hypothetical protein KP509_35G016800 [Ceratopteris richardii]|uniref:Uncharacterized protein n=1 Tax=Ceratopteris richardii TaxID=49495 RepID=A0A8T2QEQ1_CERRI|nr:hypothetical protein KP509_35G016800 [Ceratopteris richardii]